MLYELKYNMENFNKCKEDYNNLIKQENLSTELLINNFADFFYPIAKGIYIVDGFSTCEELQFMKSNYKIFENDFCETGFYGLCDNEMQILNKYKYLLEDKTHKFIIVLTNIYREEQPDEYGFRFHKWGEYIGNFDIRCEYLKNQTDMDKVVFFKIIEII